MGSWVLINALWYYANTALRDYASLFARVDLLVLLAPPSFDTVLRWRIEQEHALHGSGRSGFGAMTDAQVARFVAHYERITCHILAEMPARADLVITLDSERRVQSVHRGHAPTRSET